MRKLMLAHPGSFPAPIHEGSGSIWHLAEVLTWREAKGGYSLERSVLEASRVALQVSLAKEAHWLPTKTARELNARVGWMALQSFLRRGRLNLRQSVHALLVARSARAGFAVALGHPSAARVWGMFEALSRAMFVPKGSGRDNRMLARKG